MKKKLNDLVEGLATSLRGNPEAELTGLVCDSREVQPGVGFVALRGEKRDGLAYVREAVNRGASAIIVDREPETEVQPAALAMVSDAVRALPVLAARFWNHPSRRMNVIGVTGTNGKTTTAFLLRHILEAGREKVGLLGTILNSRPGRTEKSDLTTLDAPRLQRWLWEMAEEQCRSCVMEVSSHSLVQGRVDEIHFAAAILTNLTRDHLDYHKTPEAYREAKALLFRRLASNAVACINRDDPNWKYFADRATGRVVTYGLEGGDVTAVVEHTSLSGSRFTVRFPRGVEIVVRSPYLGRHNVQNSLAAAACLYSMGYDADVIQAGLEARRPIPGRLEEVSLHQPFRVFVDYAHTPHAMEQVLGALRWHTPGKLWVVFGCGGDRDRGKRPLMGAIAGELAHHVILTSDNPRSEEPEAILEEIKRGVSNRDAVKVIPDRAQAIEEAIRHAKPGDTVLIAGKGHEDYQILKDRVIPFDDREVAVQALKKRLHSPRRSSSVK